MMETGWVEIPAHRVYVLTDEMLGDAFEIIRETEEPNVYGNVIFRRRSDGKLFRWSPWQLTEAAMY